MKIDFSVVKQQMYESEHIRTFIKCVVLCRWICYTSYMYRSHGSVPAWIVKKYLIRKRKAKRRKRETERESVSQSEENMPNDSYRKIWYSRVQINEHLPLNFQWHCGMRIRQWHTHIHTQTYLTRTRTESTKIYASIYEFYLIKKNYGYMADMLTKTELGWKWGWWWWWYVYKTENIYKRINPINIPPFNQMLDIQMFEIE